MAWVATSGMVRRPGGVAIGMRCATVPAGGAPIGSPRPPRRDPDEAAGQEGPADDVGPATTADDVEDADAVEDADDGVGVPMPAGSGAPRPAGGAAAPGPSAQRLAVRAGGVPRGAGSGADPEEPGAETGGAMRDAPGPVPACAGREDEAEAEAETETGARGDEALADADDADRCSGLAEGAGAVVSGRDEGMTVAAGETEGNDRTGASATASDQAPGASHVGPAEAEAAVRRCTGRVGIGECEVRLGIAAGFASTRPAGAAGPVS